MVQRTSEKISGLPLATSLDGAAHIPAVYQGTTYRIPLSSLMGNASTETTAPYTQPIVGANITVSVVSSLGLAVGVYIFIDVGGYYQVASVPGATEVTVQNVGTDGNATPGLTVAAGSQVFASGPPGEPGVAGDPLDPTVGSPAFTGDDTGTTVDSVSLTTGKHYLIAFSGISYTASLTDGARSRPYDISVCISTITGSAVLQSPVVGRSVISSGAGELEIEVSGLVATLKVYGGPFDTEHMVNPTLVREYDPAIQIAGWYPTQEADCIFCWDANVGITKDGSNDISAWLGQVGTVTATASSAKPNWISGRASLNNQPAVWFDQASSEKLTVANLTVAASDLSAFCAIDQISLDNDGYIFDSAAGRLVLASDRNTTAIAFNDGSFKAGNTSAQTGAHSIGWILDGSAASQATMRKNRAVIATGQTYTRVAIGGTTKLGSQNSGTTSGLFNGYMGILFGFSSVDPARRFKAEKYMLERFGT